MCGGGGGGNRLLLALILCRAKPLSKERHESGEVRNRRPGLSKDGDTYEGQHKGRARWRPGLPVCGRLTGGSGLS